MITRLLVLALALTACVPGPSPETAAPPPIGLTILNNHFDDVEVYAIPCGRLECRQRIAHVHGGSSETRRLAAHYAGPDGRLWLAYRYLARNGFYLADPIAVSDVQVVLSLSATRGVSFTYAVERMP